MAEDDREESLPPLYHACVANDVALVGQLLAAGADPNDGESVYHAAQLNRRECLALLLAHGADLSGRNAEHSNTPLYFLAGHREGEPGTAEAVLGMQWLLEHGADPNVPSYDTREAPLHCLARNGWSEPLVTLFLAHGASPDLPRADGRTVYVLAVRSGNVRCAELLRSRGAQTVGVGPVDELLGACLRADAAAAHALMAAHPDLMAALTEEDRGAMVQAVYHGREPSLRLMTAIGFDLRAEGDWGGTPLHHAAWLGDLALVRTLLALGAPVNVRDNRFGSSPLGWAAHGSTNCGRPEAEHAAVVAALLDAGSDRATSINRWNEPPEGMASPQVTELLRSHGFTT
jgi:ankyrin repeat protein